MATKTESDYASDEEFQERISDELRTFYFPDFYDFACELEHEIFKKRFDRASKIFEIMVDKRNHNMYDPGDVFSFLRQLTMTVFRLMPAAEPGCSETLQFMSSNFGLAGYASDCAQKRMVVRQASLGGGDDSVDTQRVLAGNSVFGCLGSGLCCTLIRASARGDLETVKSCLAVKEFQSFPESTFCHHVREFAVRVAAHYGHTHIVEAFFFEWERRAEDDHSDWVIYWLREDVLSIACRSSNFEMIVSLLRARNENWDEELAELFGKFNFVRCELYCTTEFLRKVSLVVRESRESYGDQINSRWLPEVLKSAIKFRSLPHVETVLDEMDPNRSGKVFTDHP